jgi:hypothetical protein
MSRWMFGSYDPVVTAGLDQNELAESIEAMHGLTYWGHWEEERGQHDTLEHERVPNYEHDYGNADVPFSGVMLLSHDKAFLADLAHALNYFTPPMVSGYYRWQVLPSEVWQKRLNPRVAATRLGDPNWMVPLFSPSGKPMALLPGNEPAARYVIQAVLNNGPVSEATAHAEKTDTATTQDAAAEIKATDNTEGTTTADNASAPSTTGDMSLADAGVPVAELVLEGPAEESKTEEVTVVTAVAEEIENRHLYCPG